MVALATRAASSMTAASKVLDSIPSPKAFRSVKRVLQRPSPHWVGDGFYVYPVLADLAFKQDVSPLLMFDYAKPKRFPAKLGAPKGVGQHPHRGFETVTIAFQGEVEHRDSTGQSGVIGPGDIQWMTAGRGIIHEEFHSKQFTREGGTFEMCQLWVNLPREHKMTAPGYQPILNESVPVVHLPWRSQEAGAEANESGASARIIAGQINEVQGAAKTFSPVQMWDISLPEAGKEIDIPFPARHNCIVFVRRGAIEILSPNATSDGEVDEIPLDAQSVALMKLDNADKPESMSYLRIRVVDPNSSIMVMGGEPLNEPIAAHGPFVMNDSSEIKQAFQDFRSGTFGQ